MTRPGQPDNRPTARLTAETRETGRGYDRHRHRIYDADDGALITVTRYADGRARATVVAADGEVRTWREACASPDDSWYLDLFGYRKIGP